MRKVKFDGLEPGMLTDAGLIVCAIKAGTDKFWGDKPAIKFFDRNDTYYGQALRSVKTDEEFEVIHETGSKEYLAFVEKLIGERGQARNDAEHDLDLLNVYRQLKP